MKNYLSKRKPKELQNKIKINKKKKDNCKQIYDEQSLAGVEPKIVDVAEIFRLQNVDELKQAEKRFLPKK